MRLGVDVDRFKFSAEDRICLRSRLGYSDDDIVMIHVGSVRLGKRLDLLLSVVQTLRRSQLKVKALIVAVAPPDVLTALRNDATRLGLDEHVRVMDFVNPSELSAYYSAADIAVWPGDISIAALEAISVGLPLVGIDDQYVRHIVKNGNGLTFTRGSEPELPDRCSALVRDAELRRRLGRLGRQFATDELSWDILAANYLRLYESCRMALLVRKRQDS
jgi:phosphatidylinositol alpha-1,6-mannosyltransferase